MTRQDMNNIILQHIDAELKDQANIGERVGSTFIKWFQTLVRTATPQQEQPQDDS